MSEELIQKKYEVNGEQFGVFEFYNIGKTNIENLKKFKIIPNKDYKEYSKKSPDALICDRRNKKNIFVVCVIEHKPPSNFDTELKQKKAFEQCNNYCQVVNSKLGIITDGNQTFWINPTNSIESAEYSYIDDTSKTKRGFSFIRNENGTLLDVRFEPSNTETIDIINLLLKTIDNENSTIRPKNTVSPSTLAKQVWQSVWLATGDDPKKCLMTFTELFIFKFLSDLEILTIDNNGNNVDFQSVITKGKTHCLKYYLNNVRPYIKTIFPAYEDGTTIINGLSLKNDQNQDSLFFDILKAFQEYGKLENIDPDFKSRLFEDFLKGTTGKKQLAQFFTPRNVIKAMVEIAQVKNLPDGSKICDPACGVGGFIIESILNRRSNNKIDFKVVKDVINSNIICKGYDYDDLTIILAKANLLISLTELIAENPSLTNEFSKLLSDVFVLEDKSIVGSLARKEPNEFNLIMSNPPYVSKGIRLYKEYIHQSGELSSYYTIPSVGKEGLFLEKILQELAPGGEAFVILPDGFYYRPSDNELKKRLIQTCYIKCIISLPEKTFYATNKKTYILGIQKKLSPSTIQDFPVFMAIAKTIGESLDVDRIRQSDNDLFTITREYKYFHADNKSYQNNFPIIKTIPYEKFKDNFNWIIENYWTLDERANLGLIDIDVDIDEDDIFNNIDFFQERLSEIKHTLEDELNKEINNNTKYKQIKLSDKHLFKFYNSTLGLTRKEYAILDTKDESDIPLYTAAKNPVAYIKKIKQESLKATNEKPHISFATDGDGTAGTNIFLHKREYYLNTTRTSFEILESRILPEYVYYYIQDIKKKYGFDYRYKANPTNISEIEILVPIDENDNYDIEAQKKFIDHYLRLHDIRERLFTNFFERMGNFKNDVKNQFDSKIKEYFSIE